MKRPNGSIRAMAGILAQLVRRGTLTLPAVAELRHDAAFSVGEREAATLAVAELTTAPPAAESSPPA